MHFSRLVIALGGLILAAPAIAAPAKPAKPAKAPARAAAPSTPVQIELAHQLDEERAERIEPLIDRFNAQQKDVQVKLVRRAEGSEPRQINLATRDEYARFVANKAKFKPLVEVMREGKEPFDGTKLAPEMRDGLAEAKGKILSLPLAFSTPVLYINRESFRKAGLDPDAPPRTWAETQETAGKLVDDEELRDAMKERGLGTPATRAQIIETLLARTYISKDGKRLIATDLGCWAVDVVCSMIPQVASPELTGEWEKRLKEMEQGGYAYGVFMHQVRELVSTGVNRVKGSNARPPQCPVVTERRTREVI